ncbi:ATP-binding protein [Reinekea sp.]|jgi:signal transduction histidine kinase/FixJ family two-component response regulator|uniref:ATP-binding protein n=1 Tax=Reinekea sp. TaxID=1970455 RepID=UPI002A7F329B|nr:ATP-binding protein [Reinekea sp.]
MLKRLILICLFNGFLPYVQAFESILINQTHLNANVAQSSDYLNMPSGSYSILQVTEPNIARQFTPVHGSAIGFAQLSSETWLTFAVNNRLATSARLFLVLEAPYLATAQLYFNLDTQGGYDRVATGADTALNKRPYPLGNYVIPITLEIGEQQIFLKIDPITATNIKLTLVDETTLLRHMGTQVRLNTLVLTLLLAAVGFAIYTYYRFHISTALWAAVISLGILINLNGWTGHIAQWLSSIPYIEVGAINVGAFLTLMAVVRMLASMPVDQFANWFTGPLIWLSRLLALFAGLACLPITRDLLSVQITLIPVAMALIILYWFEKRPNSLSDRLAMAGCFILLVYFICTTLFLVGLLPAYGVRLYLLSLLALLATSLVTAASWQAGKIKGARLAVEGLNIPDVHWPLLRKLNHDIRGPINGVLGMTELMQDTLLSAHQQEYVNSIQDAGFSLLREADQLQNLIRIGLNRLPESDDEFDLFDLIEDTVQPFSRIAHSKHLELVLDIAPELPTQYHGNAQIIGQVLSNLLDNALKYTAHGEVLVQVKPWQNQRIRFSITDTGPGIAKDSKARLFRFPDSNDAKQQLPKDVHLGLPISKYLVGTLGGQLSLSSELRVGTSFWVDLPLATAPNLDDGRKNSSTPLLDDLRLMVVDDNLTCRKVIDHLATSWGLDVLSLSNGQSALANLHNEYHKGLPVDVLILDQNMPTMTGSELAQRIRQDGSLNKDIIIIMMTASDEVANDFSGDEFGIEYVLSKPVSARTLRQTLNRALPTIMKNRENIHAKNSLFY